MKFAGKYTIWDREGVQKYLCNFAQHNGKLFHIMLRIRFMDCGPFSFLTDCGHGLNSIKNISYSDQ
ncbi:hypothetical protein DX873_16205 [Flagellimonas nanhaiensis]|uniref:Uncharacterized protein n=1 Tax=Flagellimonas nanhaiensis TaxID=2292706 RepID=A0A371JLX4_9FLAO|nr:hypothetical protein DX873_16205 [Allomuricauda nanhaiensis]